jgi:hypothetical protein
VRRIVRSAVPTCRKWPISRASAAPSAAPSPLSRRARGVVERIRSAHLPIDRDDNAEDAGDDAPHEQQRRESMLPLRRHRAKHTAERHRQRRRPVGARGELVATGLARYHVPRWEQLSVQRAAASALERGGGVAG